MSGCNEPCPCSFPDRSPSHPANSAIERASLVPSVQQRSRCRVALPELTVLSRSSGQLQTRKLVCYCHLLASCDLQGHHQTCEKHYSGRSPEPFFCLQRQLPKQLELPRS